MLNNPATTAFIEEDFRVLSSYRNQWSSVNTPFKTMLALGEAKLRRSSDSFIGTGVSFIHDKAGSSKLGLFQANASMAYHIKLGRKDYLSSGLTVGYRQRSITIDGLRWDNQFNGVGVDPSIDPGEAFGNQKSSAIDIGGGLFWSHDRSRRYDVGLAMWHYGQANGFLETTVEKVMPRYVGSFTWYETFGAVSTQFQSMWMQQGGAMQLVLGAVARYRVGADSRFTTARTSNAVLGGVHYRYADAVLIYIGYEYKRQLELGVNYDVTLSNLARQNQRRGGFELTLAWKAWYADQRMRLR